LPVSTSARKKSINFDACCARTRVEQTCSATIATCVAEPYELGHRILHLGNQLTILTRVLERLYCAIRMCTASSPCCGRNFGRSGFKPTLGFERCCDLMHSIMCTCANKYIVVIYGTLLTWSCNLTPSFPLQRGRRPRQRMHDLTQGLLHIWQQLEPVKNYSWLLYNRRGNRQYRPMIDCRPGAERSIANGISYWSQCSMHNCGLEGNTWRRSPLMSDAQCAMPMHTTWFRTTDIKRRNNYLCITWLSVFTTQESCNCMIW